MSALILLGATPRTARADVDNGGFESGDLTGWTTSGNVEVLSGVDITPNISAPEGTYFALLSSGPGTTGAGGSGADRDASGLDENDIATLSQTFDVTVDSSLTFTVAFATSEVVQNVDDIFEVLVDAAPVAQGSVPGVAGSPFADFGTLDGTSYTVSSSGPTDGSIFDDGITATAQFNLNLTPGSHTIEFFVGDESDTIVDSGLIVDNLLLTPLITLEPQTAINTAGEEHTVTATVTDGQGQPLEGAAVQFDVVAGPNTGTSGACSPNADCTTDADGQASFAYAGADAGTDTIQACFLDQGEEQHCATAPVEWLAPTPTPTPGPNPPTPTATAIATASPTPAPAQLPDTGGTPSDGASALPWPAAIAGAVAMVGAGGLWFAYQRRRVR